MADKVDDANLVSLEAGDEFEDFPVESWDASASEGTDTNLWEEQWEDDDVADDDFATQLKAELAKTNK